VNVPNAITFGRLLAVPLTVWLILEGRFAFAFWVFVLAGVSDAVDGWIAKTFQQVTDLGRYLDPIADKALLVAVYVTLGVTHQVPTWLVILVVSRDIAILGGVLLARFMELKVRVAPLAISKVNTGAQIALAALVLGQFVFAPVADWLEGDVLTICIAVVAATTLASGLTYLYRFAHEARAVSAP
jgi:cardiolipin synthase